jgi:hypothetical protein
MATKKLICVLFGILVISAWVLGSANETTAETLNFRNYSLSIKGEIIPIGDVEGHVVIFDLRKGFYVFENGEVATSNAVIQSEQIKDTGLIVMYVTLTFAEGSTIILKSQGMVGVGSGGFRSEIIKGTGRFEGIKGTHSFKSNFIPPEKGEAGPKSYGEGTITYTLPSK